MRNYKLISSILSRPWLIDPQWVQNNIALVHQLLTTDAAVMPSGKSQMSYGIDVPDVLPDRMTAEQYIEANMYNPRVLQVQGSTVRASFWRSFNEAPKNSLALIPVIGAVSKYYDCGIAGTSDMARWVKEANDAPNIAGIILQIDSPGGMVDGTQTLVDAILQSEKPVTAYIDDGMAASAAMWIASAADEIVVSQKTDMLGSIGVLTTLADYTGFFEQKGIKLHEIYAPQSTDKNKDYRDALKGDYKAVKGELAFIAQEFINAIKSNRAAQLNPDAGDPFTGKMYFADQAIEIGLADRIGSIEHAVEGTYSRVRGKRNKATSKTTTNMFGNKFPKLSALKGKAAEEITTDEVEAIQAELKANGIENVMIVTESMYNQGVADAAADAGKATADKVVKLIADLDAANAAKTTAEENLTKAQADLKAANDKITELEKGDSGEAAKLKAEKEKEAAETSEIPGFTPTPISELQR
jgi:protease-4